MRSPYGRGHSRKARKAHKLTEKRLGELLASGKVIYMPVRADPDYLLIREAIRKSLGGRDMSAFTKGKE